MGAPVTLLLFICASAHGLLAPMPPVPSTQQAGQQQQQQASDAVDDETIFSLLEASAAAVKDTPVTESLGDTSHADGDKEALMSALGAVDSLELPSSIEAPKTAMPRLAQVKAGYSPGVSMASDVTTGLVDKALSANGLSIDEQLNQLTSILPTEKPKNIQPETLVSQLEEEVKKEEAVQNELAERLAAQAANQPSPEEQARKRAKEAKKAEVMGQIKEIQEALKKQQSMQLRQKVHASAHAAPHSPRHSEHHSTPAEHQQKQHRHPGHHQHHRHQDFSLAPGPPLQPPSGGLDAMHFLGMRTEVSAAQLKQDEVTDQRLVQALLQRSEGSYTRVNKVIEHVEGHLAVLSRLQRNLEDEIALLELKQTQLEKDTREEGAYNDEDWDVDEDAGNYEDDGHGGVFLQLETRVYPRDQGEASYTQLFKAAHAKTEELLQLVDV